MTSRPILTGLAFCCVGLVACERRAGTSDSATSASRSTVPSGRDTVFVELDEWRVRLSRDTIPAGPVVFHVVNEGALMHDFEVESGKVEYDSGDIEAGGSANLRANLAPGFYTVYCSIAGPEGAHGKMGMSGSLVVQ